MDWHAYVASAQAAAKSCGNAAALVAGTDVLARSAAQLAQQAEQALSGERPDKKAMEQVGIMWQGLALLWALVAYLLTDEKSRAASQARQDCSTAARATDHVAGR